MSIAPTPEDKNIARQTRLVAYVLAGTMLSWMGLQWLGGRMGWETRFVFLFDLAAIAAFIWALVVTFRIWRQGKSRRPGN
ncbi:hypothetical protein E7811_11765 [Aliigemmobacter aestuarii]|uniref:DUF5337 domain-containing protein n=1 Tax=Aliigemmobacter aestuarii TaxID=1445661 RepID=A0A4V3V086_9RHOB|nr:DUF5337 domain-containing protein [Gemmobacter aestuarii]THD82830.1 hypothetical protein E7811_11765 [Gemmobacter aestuarii]